MDFKFIGYFFVEKSKVRIKYFFILIKFCEREINMPTLNDE